MKKNRVLIVAGGTGGHISPGLALFDSFGKENAEFLTLQKNERYAGLPEGFLLYDSPPFPGVKTLLIYPFKLLRSVVAAAGIIRRKKIDIVVTLGGFPTIGALIAAVILRKKIYMCEQNSVAGQVTRLFARFAQMVFLTFPLKNRVSGKTMVTGNPIREAILLRAANQKQKRKAVAKPTVFVLGGSQGSRQINEMICGILESGEPALKGIHFNFQCGENHITNLRNRIGDRKDVTLFGFSNSIHDFYESSDLLIGRSGAGVVTESVVFGLPMLLIPLPTSKDNHQYENARICEAYGAARIFSTEKDDWQGLLPILKEALERKELEKMRAGCAKLRDGVLKSDAAETIVRTVLS